MTNAPSGAPITLAHVEKIVGKKLAAKQRANAASCLAGLSDYGQLVGLNQPHRLAHYLSQILHESGAFAYDREVWGPTPAQKRYEGRKDLGNTVKGDGSRYRGRGPIQITGRANYRSFTKWAKRIDPNAPNFEANPEAVVTDPWEGLGPIWYWDSGNPDGRSLNRYADDNNIEMVTRRINGGLNGYADRVNWYVKVALVLLGYGPKDVRKFQQEHPEAGAADGIAGEKTRMALHRALKGANPYREVETVEKPVPAPVPEPYVPDTVDQEVRKKTGLWGWITSILGGGGAGLAGLLGADWQTILAIGGVALVMLLMVILLRRQIVAALQEIREGLA